MSAHEHTALFQPRHRKTHILHLLLPLHNFERSFLTVMYQTTSFVIVPGVHISDVYIYWKIMSKKIAKFLKLETMLAFSTQKWTENSKNYSPIHRDGEIGKVMWFCLTGGKLGHFISDIHRQSIKCQRSTLVPPGWNRMCLVEQAGSCGLWSRKWQVESAPQWPRGKRRPRGRPCISGLGSNNWLQVLLFMMR